MRLDLENEPQPDGLLLIDTACGGQARIAKDDYIEGASELVVEIASSNVSLDLHLKRDLYRRFGVREYLVWRVLDQRLDWFVNHEGLFEQLPQDTDGLLKSQTFRGLWLDHSALVAGDLARVLEQVRQGLNNPAHQAFLRPLRP